MVSGPYWLAVLLVGMSASLPWLSLLPKRFSLRTLLIATTLVAVVLGLIVWALGREGRMRFRKLRIAFSATCLIACVLLIVLWVRSYWCTRLCTSDGSHITRIDRFAGQLI